ncbi:hypothetical protein Tco_1244639, partial [Tanacetum coccineum]
DHIGAKDCCFMGLRKKRCGASCNEGIEVLFVVKIIKEAKIAYGSIMGHVEQLGGDVLKLLNNWANAIAKSYKDLEENKLLRKTGDMGSFIKWYCTQIGKSKLNKVDLEGPAYKTNLVNPEGNQTLPDMSKPLPLGGPPVSPFLLQEFSKMLGLQALAMKQSVLHGCSKSTISLSMSSKDLWLVFSDVDTLRSYGMIHEDGDNDTNDGDDDGRKR